MNRLTEKLGIQLPIIQAPMAGVSTPQMAAAVSNAGALGSIGIGAVDAAGARKMILATRTLTDKPFNVNVFCHHQANQNPNKERAWLATLAPHFAKFGANPPQQLNEIYKSFVYDEETQQLLLLERPAVVSFHFGLPKQEYIDKLKAAGIVVIASATNCDEAERLCTAEVDAIVAQGYEAGGHRGTSNPAAEDTCLGTFALTRLLVRDTNLPIISAGGIMDGAGVAACLELGASAAQLGTAFIACPESSADENYKAAIMSGAAYHTIMTQAISGREARCLANQFTKLGSEISETQIPDYPIAYDAAKNLNAIAKAHGEGGYGAQWAGQGAPLARSLPAATLVEKLMQELEEALDKHQYPTRSF
jgi:nitronate monooxygenase